MALSVKNKWLAVSTLAIVLPISLLAAFKFTGILNEPLQPETITLETVSWDMERPSETINVFQRAENKYCDNGISVNMSLHVAQYREDPAPDIWPFYGNDGIEFATYVKVIAEEGFIVSMATKYRPTDTNSALLIGQGGLELINTTLADVKKVATDGNEAYLVAEASSSPSGLKVQSYWIFSGENIEEHQLNVTAEVVYFNGTTYKRVVIPAFLQVWPDTGNEFETAKIIDLGVYLGSLHWRFDLQDFYGVAVNKGQVITIQMIPQTLEHYHPDYDLYLYDPNMELRGNSCSRGVTPEHITFTADSTGIWYIQVKHSLENSARNQYLLNVNVSDHESGEA